jgi:hypothetical protein
MTSGYVSARSFSEISSRTTCTTPDGDTRCHGGQRPCAGRRRKSRCCHRKWEECLPIEFALRFTFCFVRADSTRSSTYMPRLYTRCCQCHHKRVSARPELTTIPAPGGCIRGLIILLAVHVIAIARRRYYQRTRERLCLIGPHPRGDRGHRVCRVSAVSCELGYTAVSPRS